MDFDYFSIVSSKTMVRQYCFGAIENERVPQENMFTSFNYVKSDLLFYFSSCCWKQNNWDRDFLKSFNEIVTNSSNTAWGNWNFVNV